MISHYNFYGATESEGPTYQTYGRLIAERYIGGDRFFLFLYVFAGRQTTGGGQGQIRQFGGGAGWTLGRHQPDQISIYAGAVRSASSGFFRSDEARRDIHLSEPLFIAAASWEKTFANKLATSARLYYFRPILETGHHGMATDVSAKYLSTVRRFSRFAPTTRRS